MQPTHRKDVCPVAHMAELLGDECTLLLIRDLLGGVKRFNQLELSLAPISSRTITNKLKMLEGHKLITRTAFKERPPRVEYELTKQGMKLSGLIEEMRKCGKLLTR
ncbi:MAG: hypothetical protein RIQ41_64 [Candidatus Parcubacteria bacterium]|jgi:DNA-binding HxlR family transcriptional regulator